MKKYIYLNCYPSDVRVKILAEKINLRKGLDLFIGENRGTGIWAVTELKSGLAVAKGITKKEAISESRRILNKFSDKQIKDVIEKGIKKYGEMPSCITAKP